MTLPDRFNLPGSFFTGFAIKRHRLIQPERSIGLIGAVTLHMESTRRKYKEPERTVALAMAVESIVRRKFQ